MLRAIAYIVRDRDWGTYEPTLSDLRIDANDAAFAVSYAAACDGPGGSRLEFQARISGTHNGILEFEVNASPDGDFETSRCGFCVLHPIVGLAGAPATVEHVDGTRRSNRAARSDRTVAAVQGMRAITHTVRPGVRAECRMEGDTFEMEDQRNWSDASYKTYVRPLELPWPYVLKSGGPVPADKCSLTISGASTPAVVCRQHEGRSHPHRTRRGRPQASRDRRRHLPRRRGGGARQYRAVATARPAAPAVALRPDAGHGIGALRSYAALAAAYPVPATLECVVACQRDLDARVLRGGRAGAAAPGWS